MHWYEWTSVSVVALAIIVFIVVLVGMLRMGGRK